MANDEFLETVSVSREAMQDLQAHGIDAELTRARLLSSIDSAINRGESGYSGVSGYGYKNYVGTGRSGYSSTNPHSRIPFVDTDDMRDDEGPMRIVSRLVNRGGTMELEYHMVGKDLGSNVEMITPKMSERDFSPVFNFSPKKADAEHFDFASTANVEHHAKHHEYLEQIHVSEIPVISKRVVQVITPAHEHDEHHIKEEIVGEINKINWKNLCIGIGASVIIALTISPDTGRHIWNFITSIFGK